MLKRRLCDLWSQLPPELLDLITIRLTFLDDVTRFGQACKSWHSAATWRRHLSHPPPLLIMESPIQERVYRYFGLDITDEKSQWHSVAESRLADGEKSDTKFMGYSASKGWLVVFKWKQEAPRLHLLNPLSGEQIDLPSKWSVPLELKPGEEIIRTVLSSDPTSGDCVVVAAAYPSLTDGTVLARCRLQGDADGWTVLYEGPRLLSSSRQMAIYSGRLYIATDEGVTMVFDLGSKSRRMQPEKVITFGHQFDYYMQPRPCLVETDGELLMLVKGYLRHDLATVFEVFKLDVDANRWAGIRSLGDRVFLLTEKSLECVSSKDLFASGFRSNCIHHLGDHDGSSAVLIYSLENGSSGRIQLPDRAIEGERASRGRCTLGAAWIKPRAWYSSRLE